MQVGKSKVKGAGRVSIGADADIEICRVKVAADEWILLKGECINRRA